MGIKIYSPSYKRAGKVRLHDYLGSDFVLCVHEFEEEGYRESYPNNEIMVLPNNTQGNMSRVRNYIVKNSEGEKIVMMDDDVISINYLEGRKSKKLSKKRLRTFIENGFIMAEEIGTKLWGVNLNADPLSYREFEPFLFASPVLAPFSGIIKDKRLKYDERLSLNEDYDYFLQVVRRHRKVLRFQKYNYRIGEFLTTEGGCSEHRTTTKEYEQAKIMMEKWGKIVRYDFEKKRFNPQINIPL